MSRLTDKLAQAAGVVARQTAKIEARADALIASEASIEAQTQSAFAPHEALLAQTEKDLADLQHALAIVSNTPPLPDTGSGGAANTHGTVSTTPDGRVLGT